MAVIFSEWIFYTPRSNSWFDSSVLYAIFVPVIWSTVVKASINFWVYFVFYWELLYSISLLEPRFIVSYLQTLRSSEELLRDQVCLETWTLLDLLPRYLMIYWVLLYYLLLAWESKEKGSCIHCYICKTGAGYSWVEGEKSFFAFSSLTATMYALHVIAASVMLKCMPTLKLRSNKLAGKFGC